MALSVTRIARALDAATRPETPGGTAITRREMDAALGTPKTLRDVMSIQVAAEQTLAPSVTLQAGAQQVLDNRRKVLKFLGSPSLEHQPGYRPAQAPITRQEFEAMGRQAVQLATAAGVTFQKVKSLAQVFPPGRPGLVYALTPGPGREGPHLDATSRLYLAVPPQVEFNLQATPQGAHERVPSAGRLVVQHVDGTLEVSRLMPLNYGHDSIRTETHPVEGLNATPAVLQKLLSTDENTRTALTQLAWQAAANSYADPADSNAQGRLAELASRCRAHFGKVTVSPAGTPQVMVRLAVPHRFLGETYTFRQVMLTLPKGQVRLDVLSQERLVELVWENALATGRL